MFDINERPTDYVLQTFCNRYGTGGAMRERMALSIGMPAGTFDDYYYGKRNKRMPAPAWTLLRITWDALLLAQWQQQHRKELQQ